MINWALKSDAGKYLLSFAIACLALTARAQTERIRITGNFGPAPLTTIFKQLRIEYDIRFAYDPDALSGEVAEISLVDATLATTMNALLEGRGLGWKVTRRTVLIYRDTHAESPPNSAAAQTNFVWTIRVVDAETGEFLPFTAAAIRYPPLSVEGDSDGRLTIPGIPSDTCRVTIRYTGYEERTIRLNSRMAAMPTIGLQPRNTLLPAAVVVASKPDLIEVAGRPGIQSFNPGNLVTISTNGETDVLRGVQLLPGVGGTTENSNGLILRGSAPDQTLVQFDDFTIYHIDHFFGLFSAINADAVKQIRVYKGGFDASQGGRAGGIVRITGKEGNRIKPSGQLTVGSLSGSLMLESPVGEKGSFIITGRQSFLDVLPTQAFRKLYTTAYLQGPGAVSEENVFASGNQPSFSFRDLTTKFTWRPGKKDKINLSGYAGQDRLEHAMRTAETNQGFTARYADQSSWGNAGAGVRWQRNLERNRRWLTTAGASTYRSSYFSADTLVNALTGQVSTSYRDDELILSDFNARSEFSSYLGKIRLIRGIHVNSNRIQRRSSGSTEPVGNAGLWSGYLQSEYQREQWTLHGGMRISYFDRFKKVYPEWRLNFSAKLNSAWSLKASTSRMHQFIHRVRPQSLNLNQADLWLISGDAEIPVLRSDQWSSGITFRKGKWMLDAEGYLRIHQGSFEYLQSGLVRPPSGDSLIFGRGAVYGIDLLAGWQHKNWKVWLAYAWLRTGNLFADYSKSRIPQWFDQPHEVKLFAEYRRGHWDAALTWIFGSGRPYTPALGVVPIPLEQDRVVGTVVMGELHSARLPAYHRLDLAAGWSTTYRSTEYSIRASVFNAYNRINTQDMRYLGVVQSGVSLSLAEERINMLGLMPSLQLRLKW